MTNFLVNSPQTLLTGTTSNDLFQITTGLAQSLYGIEGADEFSATTNATNFTQTVLNGGAGNDTIKFLGPNGTNASATLLSVLGGGGSDYISGVLSASANVLLVQGGGDGDDINFSVLTASTGVTLNGNGGNDTISATFSAVTNSLLAFGGGDDRGSALSLNGFTTATLIGGGGNDIISATITAASNVVIAGDTDSEISIYDGADTIGLTLSGTTDSLVQGNGGNDVISGLGINGGMTIAGNSGDDTIQLDDISGATRTLVNGGGGNDLISAIFDSQSIGLTINGGGGKDTIALDAANGSGLTGSSFYFGGLGADKIEFGGLVSGTGSEVYASYDSAEESNLSAYDTISALSTANFKVASFQRNLIAPVATSQGTDIVAANTGAVTFANTYALGLTARAEGINGLGTAAGTTYYFADGLGSQYLFVQGGSTGTSDDLIIKNSTGTIDGITISTRGVGQVGGIIDVDLLA